MPRIDWSTLDVSKDDLAIIRKIVKRAAAADLIVPPLKPMDLLMDLEATHANGNPLRLQALLDADAFNFAHDIYGIQNTMDRANGVLTNCFQPRFTDYAKLREACADDEEAAS
jgi:hypothetical protein